MKKFLCTLLVLSIIGAQLVVMPVYAQTKLSSRISKDKISTEQKYQYMNVDWWQNFNDAYLIEYINKAFSNNNDLKIAGHVTEEFYQASRLQFSQELPQIGAGFAPINYKLPDTNKYNWRFFLPIAINYEADVFLKNHDKTNSSKKTYQMSLQDERTVYIGVISGVATVYLNIVKLDNVIGIQEHIVNNRKTIYDLMQKRNKSGLTSKADVVRAEQGYTQSVMELSDLIKEREKLLNQLAVLTGDSPYNISEYNRTSLEDINFTGTIPAEISTEIIENRPDYIKAEVEVEKAGLDVRIAKKEFLPTFDIAGLALFNASDFGSTLTTANSLLAFGAGVLQPIFTGGAKVANLRLKKASYERILENYKKTNLVAMQEINDSLVTIKQDEGKYKDTIKQQELSEKNYFYNKRKYEKGLISYLDFIQSEESLLNINKLAAIQKMDNYINYIGLYKATGAKL